MNKFLKNVVRRLCRLALLAVAAVMMLAILSAVIVRLSSSAEAQQVQANFATTNFCGSQTLTNNATLPLFPGINQQITPVLTNGAFGPPVTWRAVYAAFRIDTWKNTNGSGKIVVFDHPVAVTNIPLSNLVASVSFSNVNNTVGQTNATGFLLSADDSPAFGASQSNGWFVIVNPTFEDFTQLYAASATNTVTPVTESWFVKARSTSP